MVDGYQLVIEVSFDDKEEPTRFSLIGKTKSTLFQESDGVVIFANFDEEKGDSGDSL